MSRSRKQIETASHYAAALHQLTVEERVLRDAPRVGRSAELGDISIDRLLARLATELGYRVEPIASPTNLINLNGSERVGA